jgi:hypothetical protein
MIIFLMLVGVALHFAQQVTPLLALWGQRLMPNLNSGLCGVVFAAKHL